MDSLPREIIQEILSRLPVKALIRSRAVCQEWRDLTKDSSFKKMHTAQSFAAKPGIMFHTYYGFFFLDRRNALKSTCFPLQLCFPGYKEFSLIASCNGLLCLVVLDRVFPMLDRNFPIFVCNPFLQKIIKLPPHKHPSVKRPLIDFGFCPKTQSYKVFQVFIRSWELYLKHPFEVFIHTLGDNSWVRIDCQINLNLIRSSGSASNVNGALHWVSEYFAGSLIVFDLELDVFKEMLGPIDKCAGNYYNRVIGNCLSIVNINDDNLVVWIMKDYWVSWEKCLVINLIGVLDMPFEFNVIDYQIEEDELLIWYNGGLQTYNIRKETFKAIYMNEGFNNFVLHFDTLEEM